MIRLIYGDCLDSYQVTIHNCTYFEFFQILKQVQDAADSTTGSKPADRALSLSKCTCHAEFVSAFICMIMAILVSNKSRLRLSYLHNRMSCRNRENEQSGFAAIWNLFHRLVID
jgi:hypothetical protein